MKLYYPFLSILLLGSLSPIAQGMEEEPEKVHDPRKAYHYYPCNNDRVYLFTCAQFRAFYALPISWEPLGDSYKLTPEQTEFLMKLPSISAEEYAPIRERLQARNAQKKAERKAYEERIEKERIEKNPSKSES